MTDIDDGHPAQAAVFCVELHRHVDALDVKASSDARKLRGQMGVQGASRKPDVILALQQGLRELALERRKLLSMLTALGHAYPCRHTGADSHDEERGTARPD